MFKKQITIIGLIISCYIAFSGSVAHSTNRIRISGSSTVAPYSQVVSEYFAELYAKYKTPIVESIGTGGGMKEFCKSSAPNSLSIVNASRPMAEKEFKECAANGVTQIKEVMFGYDGIVLASDRQGPEFKFVPSDIYKALAAKVLVNGNLVDNPYKTWNEINPNFPNWKITVYVPGEKHGTREVFEQKLMEAGCKDSGVVDFLKSSGREKEVKSVCAAVRKDGTSVDIDGDYSETLARLTANKHGVGVFGLFYYENNADRLRLATVNDIAPTVSTIASGIYPVSRPLYFYVKYNNLKFVPGLKEYVNFFLQDKMIGDEGALVDYGLVPAPKEERDTQRKLFISNELFSIKKK